MSETLILIDEEGLEHEFEVEAFLEVDDERYADKITVLDYTVGEMVQQSGTNLVQVHFLHLGIQHGPGIPPCIPLHSRHRIRMAEKESQRILLRESFLNRMKADPLNHRRSGVAVPWRASRQFSAGAWIKE